MEPLGYYKWHWQAWRANRRVQRMTCLQKGIYRELLDECWADGSISDDISALADIAGCTEQELTDAWQLLRTCFYEVAPGRLTNRKLEEQRTETDTLRATRARAGEAGGKQKLANAKQVSSTCHIEEREEREEKREKSKRVPSRDKREGDNRHGGFKDAFFHSFTSHNQIEPPWDGQEGKALSKFLAATPKITQEHWETILKHRFASEGANGDALSTWVKDAQRWYKSPLDRFGKPKGVANQPKFLNPDEAY